MKSKKPYLPPERLETVRLEITGLIKGAPLSAGDISTLVGVPEKEVGFHLEHIRRMVHNEGLPPLLPHKLSLCR